MVTMRRRVEERVGRLENYHQRLKTRRYGWLVRPGILLAGTLMLVLGLLTIPFPGPGWLTVFVAIGVLSLEARWAQAILHWGVGIYDRFFTWYHRQPRTTRWTMTGMLLLLCFVTFLAITWVTWGLGGLDFLNPVLDDRLGMTRF